MRRSTIRHAIGAVLAGMLLVVLAACGPMVQYSLTVETDGTGSGTVTSEPAGIDTAASDPSTADFSAASLVTLTAQPAPGSTFVGWSGAKPEGCEGAPLECVVDIQDNFTYIATFEADASSSNTLTVTVDGSGDGVVTSDPAGIDTSSANPDTADFADDSSVTLTAAPEPGSVAVWTGCDSFTATTCELTMDGARSVTTTFEPGTPGTTEVPIANSEGDAEEFLSDSSSQPVDFPAGFTYTDSSDLELVVDPDHSRQVVGLRFDSVAIPAGATITGAELVFTARGDTSSATTFTVTIAGEANANPSGFVEDPVTTGSSGISSRTTTSSTTEWTFSDANAWVGDREYASPDLTSVVQEIVNLAAWSADQPMVFILSGSEDSALRRAYSYDTFGDGTFAPVLRVEFTTAAP